MLPRVLLMAIDPWKGGANGKGRYAPFNYSVRKIQAATIADPRLAGIEVRVLDTDSKDVDALVEQIEALDPDIIGASTYVWSFPTFVSIAQRLKQTRPDRTVIFGGPSARVEMFRLPPYVDAGRWVDALVLGEGEEIFQQIVGMKDRSRDALRSVPGLALQTQDGWLKTAEAALPVLDSLASPFQLRIVPPVVTAHLETFRGCPMSCTFCQWGDLSDARRIFSTEYIIRELEAFKALGVAGVEIVDAGLNLNPRAFRNLVAAEKEVRFLETIAFKAEVYPSHLTDEHLAFLEQIRPDCLGIGLQSYDDDVLRRMERPFNAARFERVVHEVAKICPNSVIEVIMGLPGDNPDSFRRTVERARKLPLPVRIYKCLVLPNALMTRSPEHYALEYDFETLHMTSCWGWSASDLSSMCEELTAMLEAEGGEMGLDPWTFRGSGSSAEHRTQDIHGGQDTLHVRGPRQVQDKPQVQQTLQVQETLQKALEIPVNRASGGDWHLLEVTRGEGRLDLAIATPSGRIVVRAVTAASTGRYYRVVEGIGYSYLRRPDLRVPDSETFDRVITRAHPGLRSSVPL